MITNSELTVYHKTLNPTTRLEQWTKYVFTHCWWFDTRGTNTNTGYEKANSVEIRIPYDINPSLNIDNFSIGDMICKGIVNADAEDVIKGEHFNITSINNNTFGMNQHIHIGGR